MANPTTAGSGGQSRRSGSSASPSRPTGRQIASASSKRRAARKRRSSAKLFRFDRSFGSRLVAGTDEAGRGCLAGPLVAAAVLFDCDALACSRPRGLSELDDSKRCTEEARERLYPLILASAVGVFVVSRSAQTIDAEGLHRTNIAALEEALIGVTATAEEQPLCLVDGFQLRGKLEPRPRAVIGGDRTSAAIAAASIVAKVTRDRLMRHAELLHPGWGFAQHVGYATPMHREAIRRLGVSPLHRLSFQSIAYGEQLTITGELAAAS